MRWILAGLVLGGCGASDSETDGSVPEYWSDVRPVLDANCARCHTEGGSAPTSFDESSDVVAQAARIKAFVEAGIMPPPAPNPECRDYEDSEKMWMNDADRQTIVDWVDGGMPLGDIAEAPIPPNPKTIAPFDVEVYGGQAYTPQFGGDGNDYRCWPISLGNTEVAYVTGFEAIVDYLSIVHHVVLFRDGAHNVDMSATDGFPCSGLGEASWEILHAWAPGASPQSFPEGSGLRVKPTDQLILQVHYFGTGESAPDNSGYGVTMSDHVEKEVVMLSAGVTDFEIPAGDKNYEEKFSVKIGGLNGLPPMTILSVWPHMHVLGSGFEYSVKQDGNDTCVMDMEGWDFHNQVTAVFKQPLHVDDGDRVELTCHWDNSADNANNPSSPPVDVQYGEGTLDEMCFGFTYAIFD